jgi:hypothetical protein
MVVRLIHERRVSSGIDEDVTRKGIRNRLFGGFRIAWLIELST